MRLYIIAILVLFGGFTYLGCSGGGGGGGAATVGVFSTSAANGPCSGVEPVGWAAEIVADMRSNSECPDSLAGVSLQYVLGEADGQFASVGADSSDYIVVSLDTMVVDGPDYDLVIYEAVTDEDDAYYDVYLSKMPDMGFVLIATVAMEGTYCIDLDGTGISEGQYVKIVQTAARDSIEDPCGGTYGADIDAIGVLNVDPCLNFVDACEYVGMKVDEMCPPDDGYRNHGAYVSCVAHAATAVIKSMDWDDCFSEEELDDVHGCVVSQRAQTDIGKPK